MLMSEANIPFLKMNGAGNKIIVADARELGQKISSAAAIALAGKEETHFDQIMEIRKSDDERIDANIRILNSDGSEAGACGNGMRCVVSYLNGEMQKPEYLFRTSAGLLPAGFENENQITVDMGSPKFEWNEIPLQEEFDDTTGIELQIGPIDDPILHTPSVANIGNPHAVFWVEDDVWDYDLKGFGPLLENHPVFPDRANISIANVRSPEHIILRTWERGAGITEACGSAACAALVCAARKGLTEKSAIITLPGGDLNVTWNERNRVLLTGPAEFEFSGLLNAETGDYTRKPHEAR